MRVGLSRDQIAKIEQGRTPLRFWVGWKLCRELNLNQVYLLKSEGLPYPFIDLDLEFVMASERARFYDICKRVLWERLKSGARVAEQLAETGKDIEPLPEVCDDISLDYNQRRTLQLKDQGGAMLREADRLEQEIAEYTSKNKETQQLTPSTEKRKFSAVQSPLVRLLARLNRATQRPGKKTELAKHLGVPAPRVSEWLNEKRSPGGETTLRMLEWVQAEEANKTKSPAPASTGARHKTRMKDQNANSKSITSNPP